MTTITAATHKRVFHRIVSGSDFAVEQRLSKLANLINECNGRVYGTSPIATMSDRVTKIHLSFEIPTLSVDRFLKEEGN